MDEHFDPYREWLGIADGARGVDHYRLLELPPGESDPKRIAQAADTQSARVRRVRPGAQAYHWSRLLDQINAAKLCLLDPASKAAYDRSLGLGQAPSGSAALWRPGGSGAASSTQQAPMALPPTLMPPQPAATGDSPTTASPASTAPRSPEPWRAPTAVPSAAAPASQAAWGVPAAAVPFGSGSAPSVPTSVPAMPMAPSSPSPGWTGAAPQFVGLPGGAPVGPAADAFPPAGSAPSSWPSPGVSAYPAAGTMPVAQAAAPGGAGPWDPGWEPSGRATGVTPGAAGSWSWAQPSPGAAPTAQPTADQPAASYQPVPSYQPAASHAPAPSERPVSFQPAFAQSAVGQGGFALSAGGQPLAGAGLAPTVPVASVAPAVEAGAAATVPEPSPAWLQPDAARSATPPAAATSRRILGGLTTVVLLAVVAGLGVVLLYVQRQGANVAGWFGEPEAVSTDQGDLPDASAGSPAKNVARPRRSGGAGRSTRSGRAPDGSGVPSAEATVATETATSGTTSAPPGQPGQTVPDSAQGGDRPTPETPSAGPGTAAQATEPGAAQPTDQPDDPQRRRAFAEAVAETRAALADRDLPAARQSLSRVKSNAQSGEDRQQTARLELLVQVVEQFWEGMTEAMAKLDALDELEIGNSRIAVVEADRNHIIVKAAGRIREFETNDMPAKLVVAIAQHYFAEDAVSKLLLGGFLAVDPDGDRVWARQLWQEAAAGQTGIDVRLLMPELDAAPPPRATGGNSAGGEPSSMTATMTAAPPEGQPLADAVAEVERKYQAQFESARGPAEKAALARRLLAEAAAAESLEVRFAMLQAARDLASQSGEAALVCAAVDALSKSFSVDVLAMKTAALKAAAGSARGMSGNRDLAIAALELAAQLAEKKQWDAAGQLAELALAAARESKSPNLMKQAAAAGQQIESLRASKTPGDASP